MRKSGYRTAFHIYLIFLLALLGALIFSALFFFSVITVKFPDGSVQRSDYLKAFTEDFGRQITFIDGKPQIKQTGIELLRANQAGIQVLDDRGGEIASYQRPADAKTSYSDAELLRLYRTGEFFDTTAFIGNLNDKGKEFSYILYFPVNVTKVTMFLNGDRFTTGKTIFTLGTGVLIMILLAGGIIYGFWITNKMNHISECVRSIAKRDYNPLIIKGSFGDVYESLNQLDQDIRDTDRLKEQTESMREEWIANITHDLKTPLSPIKGYAEILFENGSITGPQLHKYSGVILKNVSSIEQLIEDLKLTYQLESAMLPVQSTRQDFVRFMKELVIDILNNPAYENRVIHFESDQEPIYFSFDEKLMARAFQNLILNSFTHGNRDTEVSLEITSADRMLIIVVSDNGPGMNPSELSMLFQRYYRGASSGQKTEGTGLGLAIAKSIVEAQGGRICADSELHAGTSFKIEFPIME